MIKLVACAMMAAATGLAQYTEEPAGAPPAEASAMNQALAQQGIKITGPDGVTVEIWLRASMPAGGKVQDNATLPVPHGALLGVIRTAGRYEDRRGQPIKAGVYTLRYSVYPVDGDHQGVAPQRDFLILGRIADDKDPNATPDFDPLMDLSRKASGTPHPLCLSLWKGGSSDGKISKDGEIDWALNTKIGDTPVAIILFGKSQA